MIGVTIGIGGEWPALARRTAATMQLMTGLECHVIDEDPGYGACHPSWLKCHVHRMFPDEDSFLVFDADILPVAFWQPDILFEGLGRPFCGAPEPNANPAVLEECKEWGLGYPDIYLNTGLTIFGREHGFVWDRVWSMHPHGGTWLEQTAVNYALALECVEVCRLPRRFNLMAHTGRINPIYARATLGDCINLHCCAMPNAAAVTTMHEQVEAYLTSGLAGRKRTELLDNLPKGSVGAELGVFCGDFSREILRRVQPSHLHLVDLFEGRVTSGNADGQNPRTVDMGVIGDELEAMPGPVSVHRCNSLDFLGGVIVSQKLLDWVYIDTSHDYTQTADELALARKAVKPGGFICGHDYSRAFPGVLQAVTEFTTLNELPVELYDGDLLPSYCIRNA